VQDLYRTSNCYHCISWHPQELRATARKPRAAWLQQRLSRACAQCHGRALHKAATGVLHAITAYSNPPSCQKHQCYSHIHVGRNAPV